MLTVVVPATDRPPTLSRCRAAIEAAREGPDELILVEQPANSGFAAARRLGAARAQGDLIAFVDADVLVHPDAFARIRAAFAADPGLAALFGSYDDSPEAPGIVSRFRNLLHHHVHQSSPGPVASFWGGLGVVRRDAFLGVGGFDPDEVWVDDIELGMRLASAGLRVELHPDIQGTHLKRWTLRSMIWTDFALRGVPWVQLLVGRRTFSKTLNLGWRHRVSTVFSLVAAASLLARRPAVVTAALGGLLLVNRPFYALLLRRRGPLEAAAGVGLHAVHHLTGAAAIPAGVALHVFRRRRRGMTRRRD
jgi:GT2 family glycosyltransferase